MKRLVGYVLLLLLLGFACSSLLARPVAFQKACAIVEGPAAPELDREPHALDARSFLQKLPYRDQSRIVYTVDPEKKYRETILEGDGNCSNLVFGTAYFLDENGIDYQIVHILPRGEFLRGLGHTLLRTRYALDGATRVGLVDVLEGGVPVQGGKPMDIDDLEHGPPRDFAIWSMNAKKDSTSGFYGELLNRSTIGYLRGDEVNRYFDFLERVYLGFGNERLEKYLYDGIAIVLNRYPKIYVASVSETFQGHRAERLLYLLSLMDLRFMLVATPLLLLGEILFFLRRRRRRAAVP